MKFEPFLFPGKVSGINKNQCPLLSGITVRIGQESLSVLVKNMQVGLFDNYNYLNNAANYLLQSLPENLPSEGKDIELNRKLDNIVILVMNKTPS